MSQHSRPSRSPHAPPHPPPQPLCGPATPSQTFQNRRQLPGPCPPPLQVQLCQIHCALEISPLNVNACPPKLIIHLLMLKQGDQVLLRYGFDRSCMPLAFQIPTNCCTGPGSKVLAALLPYGFSPPRPSFRALTCVCGLQGPAKQRSRRSPRGACLRTPSQAPRPHRRPCRRIPSGRLLPASTRSQRPASPVPVRCQPHCLDVSTHEDDIAVKMCCSSEATGRHKQKKG